MPQLGYPVLRIPALRELRLPAPRVPRLRVPLHDARAAEVATVKDQPTFGQKGRNKGLTVGREKTRCPSTRTNEPDAEPDKKKEDSVIVTQKRPSLGEEMEALAALVAARAAYRTAELIRSDIDVAFDYAVQVHKDYNELCEAIAYYNGLRQAYTRLTGDDYDPIADSKALGF